MSFSSSSALPSGLPSQPVAVSLLPITLAVFIAFLTIGLPLPVLPLHLHDGLGLGPTAIGIVIGTQFATAVSTRAWAGSFADTRGAKRAVVLGLLMSSLSGAAYAASQLFVNAPMVSAGILLLGRVLLGCGESLVATGALTWSVGRVGASNAGKVMAWVGIAMYGAYACGAPAGVAVYARWGFMGIGLAAVVIPLLALATIVGVPSIPPSGAARVPFYRVLNHVWIPGLGLALSSMGFGLITAFIALLFSTRGWGDASLAFTAFGLAFIGARLFFGHLPDKIGGARIALVCVGIEALGQLAIWGADGTALAYLGAALTGFGYSLAFPGFGVEAVRRAPPQSRGAAMGSYVAFLDLSLGLTAPAAGLAASAWGVGSVYLIGAGAVSLAAVVAVWLLRTER